MSKNTRSYWGGIEIALDRLSQENAPTPDLQKKYAGETLEEVKMVLNLKSQGTNIVKFNTREKYEVDEALRDATEIHEVDIDRFVVEYEGNTSLLIATFRKKYP